MASVQLSTLPSAASPARTAPVVPGEEDGPDARLMLAVNGLQVHLQRIQTHMQAMAQQCSQAEERIRTSQGLQNHFAREFRAILDLTRSIPDDRQEIQLDR